MRTVYATTLTVNNPADSKIALKAMGEWVRAWYERQPVRVLWPKDFQRVFEGANPVELLLEPKPGHRIVLSSRAPTPEGLLVDLVWDYPDMYDQTLGWTIRLGALLTNEVLTISIEVAVKGLTFQIVPASVKLGAPRLVRDISRLRSVSIGTHSYNLAAEITSAEEIEVLAERLLDQTRAFPVVVVSRQLSNERPLVNSLDLVERLAGIVQVFELEDRWAGFALTDQLGKELSCYAGAVRLYWPRLSLKDDPFRHPSWMPWALADAASVELMADKLMALTSEAAAFRHIEPFSITQARSDAELEAREARRGDKPNDIDLLIEDVTNLEELLKKANSELGELRAENSTLKDNVAALSTATYATAYQPVAQSLSAAQPTPAEPETVKEAVEFARNQTKHLEYLPIAFSSAEDSPFKKPHRALEALLAVDLVAGQWLASIDGGKTIGPMHEHFKKLGFTYKDDISPTSRGKWGNEYRANYKGSELDISQHITIGAKQADTCLSVHMAWLKDERKVVIAHVGRHKTNTRS